MGGGSVHTWVAVGPEAIDPEALRARVAHPSAGAIVQFLGTVRDHSAGKTEVTHLTYEAFSERVEEKIREIVEESLRKWDLIAVAVQHRVGEVVVGEPSVAVTVSSAHRSDAFESGRYLIDELKGRAPIWKKEHWPGGAEWSPGA